MDPIVQEFVTDAREGLETLDTDLVQFERRPDDPELLGRIFRIVHTIKGTCGFLGLDRLQTVAHSAENVLGGFRDGSLKVTAEAVSAVLESVDAIRNLLEALQSTGEEPAGDDLALIARLDRACVNQELKAGGPAATETGATETATIKPPSTPKSRPLIDQLGGDSTIDAACDGLHAALSRDPTFTAALASADPDLFQAAVRDALCAIARRLAGPDALARALDPYGVDGAVSVVAKRVRAALLDLEADPAAIDLLLPLPTGPKASAEPVATLAPEPASTLTATSGDAAAGEPGAVVQTIRVGVDVLEHLMTVASELVLIRNQLVQTLRDQPESPFAAPLHRLNQVTTELQESVMTTRMQPISGAWAKLPRVVRDLARDLGKQIELVTQGQTTELDRQVLELIKDPLTHMIRNAADHGLEGPAERTAAGKSPVGRITLNARHEGGAILIEVSDDGRGLSAARIREKAVRSGLTTQAAAEAMSDAEAQNFIFAAGFSTAASVTSVSGRGVGMDVVRTNIDQIGGAVEVSSVEGQGARFTIRIPLTLTIVSALIVECGGQRFAMPQSSLLELVGTSGASGRAIEYVGGAAVLRLRDRLLPLISLQTMLGISEPAAKRETCIVVARVGSFTFGIIVDRVFDTEEIVVKPVSQALRHLKVYSGSTILGDGSVIMILDFKGMASETGALHAGGYEPDREITPARPATSLLVFRAIGGTLKAAPLTEVNRIEEINAAQLEIVGGRSVVQYRGRLTPVVTGYDPAPVRDVDGRRPMMVFSRDDKLVGLIAEEIVDIVDVILDHDMTSTAKGSLGSLIVAGAATELIDVEGCWRSALGQRDEIAPPARGSQRSLAAPSRPKRRLLIVDRSPFSLLLLQPLLARAPYDVTVVKDAPAALTLHDAGESFDLILADTDLDSASARLFISAFAQAQRWQSVPMLGLGLQSAGSGVFDEGAVLSAVSDAFEDDKAAA